MDTLKISQIVPDENQPRKYFPADKMRSLQENIKREGIITPLVVQEMAGGNYLLIDGERRYRCAVELGLKEVPVVIEKPSTKVERLVRQFSVQEMHEGWTAIEKANALVDLSGELGLSLTETCKLLGIGESMSTRYAAFANLVNREAFIRSEIPLDFSESIVATVRLAERLTVNQLQKDFPLSEKKHLEARLVFGIKEGTIVRKQHVTRIKDAFTKDPTYIEKFIHDKKMSADALYIVTQAASAHILRNLIYTANYVSANCKHFLDKKDMALTTEQLDILATAKMNIEKVLNSAH